jgi:hypothetical protein
VRYPIVAAVLLALATAGCASFHPPVPDLPLLELTTLIEREHGITLTGTWTESELKQLHLAFHEQQKHVIAAVGILHRRTDASHFNDPNVSNVAGHCYRSGDICLRAEYCTHYGITCHEVGHAYAFSLGGKFMTEWSNAAGTGAYGKSNEVNGAWVWQDNGIAPRDGILTPYGGRNADEDVAEWYAACRLALRKDANSALFRVTADAAAGYVHLQTGEIHVVQVGKHKKPPDGRFAKKLSLLKKWKFLTDDEYTRLDQYVK